MGYYALSYYPYKNKIDFLVRTNKSIISNKTLILLRRILVLKKETNFNNSQSSDFFLRTRAMMSVYNKFTFQKRRHIPNNLWKLDRFLWSYVSYIHMDINDITSLYLNFKVYPNEMKIYEYSYVIFQKDINNLTNLELIELYKIGK